MGQVSSGQVTAGALVLSGKLQLRRGSGRRVQRERPDEAEHGTPLCRGDMGAV